MKLKFMLLPLVLALTACGGGSDSSDSSSAPTSLHLPNIISGELLRYDEATGEGTVGRYDVNLSGLSVQRSLTDQSLQPGMMLTLKTDGPRQPLYTCQTLFLVSFCVMTKRREKARWVAMMSIFPGFLYSVH